MSERLYLPDYWDSCKPATLRARLAAIAPGRGQVLPSADAALVGLLLTRDTRALLVYDYPRLQQLYRRAEEEARRDVADELRGALLRALNGHEKLAGSWAPLVVRGVLPPPLP